MDKLKEFYFILRFIIWFLLIFSLTITSGKVDLPKISIYNNILSGADNLLYRRPQPSTNISLRFHNETVYVVPPTVISLTIICNASYPVMWSFQNIQIHTQMLYNLRVTTTREAGNLFDPTTFKYTTKLSFYYGSNSKLTGNYTCSSTVRDDIQSSVFIFWEGIHSEYLIYSGETRTVYSENGQVILPCIMSRPDIKRPKLRKELNPYENMQLNDSISFNHKTGFLLKDLPNPAGKYKCLTSDDDYMLINVVVKNVTGVTTVNYSNATFTYNEDKHEIVCCSSSSRPPNILMFYCQHPTTCKLRSDTELYFHLLYSRRKKKGNCSTYKVKHFHTGLIRCFGDGIDMSKEFITPILASHQPWNTNTSIAAFFRWEEIDSQDMLYIITDGNSMFARSDHPERGNTVYSGQTVSFRCQISQYYFSAGIQWAVGWKNETLTHVSPPSDDQTYYSRQITVTGDINMESVICFAPVWNSSVWVTKTHYLYVNQSIVPTLKNSVLEELTWNINDTNRVISCEAEGVPIPSINWEKDNETLQDSTNLDYIHEFNETHGLNSTLKIVRVTYGTHGVYKCTATNFGGEVSKIFKVTVLDSNSWKRTVIILVVSGIIILGLLAGMIFLYMKKFKDRKAIELLTSVAFKDVATREDAVNTDVNNTTHDNGKMVNSLID